MDLGRVICLAREIQDMDMQLNSLKEELTAIPINERQEAALKSLLSFVDAYNTMIATVGSMNPKLKSELLKDPLKVWEYITLRNNKAEIYKPGLEHFYNHGS